MTKHKHMGICAQCVCIRSGKRVASSQNRSNSTKTQNNRQKINIIGQSQSSRYEFGRKM